MSIDPITKNLFESALGATMPKGPGGTGSVSFADQLKSKIEDVNKLQNDADTAMEQSSVKGATNIHETMIRLEEADMGLRMLAKVRNKALDAYHEVMHMQF
ncbi:putative Flagellar hook-basal body complex protein FliE [Syntrophobacter sp. SbD1]|nr:putative Flagellar hook-basal body complex protein FliE [Syntrophobacter sp. SbD1]